MTDSKLVVIDAMANEAIRDEAGIDGGMSPAQAMAEIEKVLGKPVKQAAALVAKADLKAPPVTDARAPATLQRAALAALVVSGDPNPEALRQAMERAGVSRDMLPQMLESPDWAGVMARICQQYLYTFSMPAITAAQISKAKLGDTRAAEYLRDTFGTTDLDRLDEQTKALSEADPGTLVRHTQSIIDDLQRLVTEAKGAGSNAEAVEAARVKAIQDALARKTSPR